MSIRKIRVLEKVSGSEVEKNNDHLPYRQRVDSQTKQMTAVPHLDDDGHTIVILSK